MIMFHVNLPGCIWIWVIASKIDDKNKWFDLRHIVPTQPQDLRVAVCCGAEEAVQRALDEGAAWKTNPNRKIILKNRWVEFQKGSWVVVSNMFSYFHPYLGKISNLTNIFQMGWNHQRGRNSKVCFGNMDVGLLNYHESVPKFGIWILELNQVGEPIPCYMLSDDCKNRLKRGCIPIVKDEFRFLHECLGWWTSMIIPGSLHYYVCMHICIYDIYICIYIYT